MFNTTNRNRRDRIFNTNSFRSLGGAARLGSSHAALNPALIRRRGAFRGVLKGGHTRRDLDTRCLLFHVHAVPQWPSGVKPKAELCHRC